MAEAVKIFYIFIEFITHPEKSRFFIYIEILFIVAFASLLFFIIVLLFKTSWLKYRVLENLMEFTTYKPAIAKGPMRKWSKVVKKLESGEESEYKLAIIEADDLLEDTLNKADYKGKTLEEKLNQLDPLIVQNTNEIKEVHKVRNNIVYNPEYKLTLEEAKRVIGVYEKTFHSLGLF